LEEDGIIFTFVGPVSQDVVEGIGSALKYKMKADDIKSSVSLKVFSIFVEKMQNVINYSAELAPDHAEDSQVRFGMIIVGKKEENYFIIGGNMIDAEQKNRLEGNLSELVQLDKDGLKELYKRKRKEDSGEHSKGAGLGFIEMARKSSAPLEYNFEKISEEHYYFTIKTVV
jgi:hypothetical protein